MAELDDIAARAVSDYREANPWDAASSSPLADLEAALIAAADDHYARLVNGIPVIENRHVREDQAYIVPLGTGQLHAEHLVVGTRRLTEAELAGAWIRWWVRREFWKAGLLPRDIAIGREPTPDSVSVLAHLRAAAAPAGA